MYEICSCAPGCQHSINRLVNCFANRIGRRSVCQSIPLLGRRRTEAHLSLASVQDLLCSRGRSTADADEVANVLIAACAVQQDAALPCANYECRDLVSFQDMSIEI